MKSTAPALFAVIILAAANAFLPARAAEPTRLYIANDDHTDYMWTADAETYAGAIALVNEFSLSSLTPLTKLQWI